jgi:hypothetical protein
VKHILLECKETKHWRVKLIHDKWLNTNKEVACRKIVKITKKKVHLQNFAKYLDIVKNKWFNKIKDMLLISINWRSYTVINQCLSVITDKHWVIMV